MKNRLKKNRTKILILEAVAAAVILFFCIRIPDEGEALDVSAGDWKSDQIQFENGAWTVQSGSTQKDDKLLSGPGMELHHGDYTVTVRYEAQENQTAEITAGNSNSRHLRGGPFILSKNQREASCDFRVTQGIGNWELRIGYSGSGDFSVRGITVVHNRNGVKRGVTWAVFWLFVLSVCWLYGKEILRDRERLLMLAGMVFMISLPLMVRGISDSDYQDLGVHLMRIEGIAGQLSLGRVPVRMQSVWLDGYGYPISIYYGDIFLYYPALLRLLGFPVVGAYKAYVLAVNTATVLIAWRCFDAVLRSRRAAYAAAFAYVSSPYRLVDVYIRAAVGEYTSLAFLPLTALAVWRLYAENPGAGKNKYAGRTNAVRRSAGNADAGGESAGRANVNTDTHRPRALRYTVRSSLLLGTSMACIICTHILTAEMAAVILALICIVRFRRTFTKRVIASLAGAAVQCILLSAWFLVPFADYYMNMTVRINDTVGNTTKMIQFGGAYLGEYFAFFRNIAGIASWDTADRLQLTPGIVLMGALLIGIRMVVRGDSGRKVRFLTLLSILLLFMASAYFPWDLLAGKSRIGNLLCQIQFPWRYLGIALVPMSLLLGFIVRRDGCAPPDGAAAGEPEEAEKRTAGSDRLKARRMREAACVLCMLTVCVFMSSYCEEAQLAVYYDTAELDTYATGGGEYLPADTLKAEIGAADVTAGGTVTARIAGRAGTDFQIDCKGGKSGGVLTVPVLAYKGYQAVIQGDAAVGRTADSSKLKLGTGANGVLTVQIPPDFDGTVRVSFVSPWYWHAAEAVSLAALLITVRMLHITRPRRRERFR